MTSSISFEQLLLEFQSLKQSIECQQSTIDALQATVIAQQATIDALQATVIAQQATILRLSLSNDLTLPIVAAIFKSHIVKATARLIFWSLRHRLNSYVPPETVTLLDALVEVMVDLRKPRSDAEQHAIFLIRPGPHLQDDMEILEDARSLRSGGYTPMHLKGRTPGNTIGDLDKKTLARLLNEYSVTVTSRNTAAHQTTPRILSKFIVLLDTEDASFYASLFKFIFQFPHTEIDKQSPDIQNQVLTNSGSFDTICEISSDETDIGQESRSSFKDAYV